MDAADPLAPFRERFYLEKGAVYLDGNSLGLLSQDAEESVLRVVREWKQFAVEGWLDARPAWFTLAESIAEKTALLIGADADQVTVANSTTVNLHQILCTLFEPRSGRDTILADSLNFPSDLYAIRSHLTVRGLRADRHLRLVPSRDGQTLDEDDILAALTDDIALAVFPSVLYASGQLLDMAALTREAHKRGVLIGFDCSHSIGAIPHALDKWGVDFAFWCSYKYLNGGPGATGGLYLNRRHLARLPGLAGWFGNAKSTQFDMNPEFDPARGAARFQIGTPGILSLAPIEGSLQLVLEAGIDRIRRKSLYLTNYLIALADTFPADYGITVMTPREEQQRGGHVALRHAEATRICKALKTARVVPDFRPPNTIRLAPVALYNSFHDCRRAIDILKSILESREYLNYPAGRNLVA